VAEKDPRRYDLSAGIQPSARKHGIADEDIRHAIRHAKIIDQQDNRRKMLYLGPARNGELLEIVTVVRSDRFEVAIHAMKMRPKYWPRWARG
jgi:hypothetical protein